MSAEAFYDAARAYKRELTGNASIGLTQDEVDAFKIIVAGWTREASPTANPWSPQQPITLNIALEIISHEAIVLEWYRDSVGVGTWSVGITNASGHNVDRYRDNPQTVQRCLEVFLWALRERYVPSVVKTFAGIAITEAQFAAALSFHYNTGKIATANWVEFFKAGDLGRARESFMDWRKPAAIIPRREKERDLFFDGKWTNDGTATIYPVKKPSYQPDFRNPQRVDVRQAVEGLL